MTVLSENLQSALSLARTNRSRSPDSRNSVLLTPGNGTINVVCADSTTETQVTIVGAIDEQIAISPQLCELVGTLKTGVAIKLTPNEKSACKVQMGKSRFTLPTTNAQDFPRFAIEPDTDTTNVTVDASALASAISAVTCGLGKSDSSKLFTTGLLFKLTDKGVYLVGTNGFKLVSVAVGAKMTKGTRAMEGVVPEMGVTQIQRLAATAGEGARINIELGARQISTSTLAATVRSRLVSCKYPDFARVTTVDDPLTVQVSKSAVMAVLKRVGLFVQESSPFVTVNVSSGKMSFSVKTPQGECDESLELDPASIRAKKNGDLIATAHVNIGYLASLFEAMPIDLATMEFDHSRLRMRANGPTHNAVAISAYYTC